MVQDTKTNPEAGAHVTVRQSFALSLSNSVFFFKAEVWFLYQREFRILTLYLNLASLID
jgi:hypothetical protein